LGERWRGQAEGEDSSLGPWLAGPDRLAADWAAKLSRNDCIDDSDAFE